MPEGARLRRRGQCPVSALVHKAGDALQLPNTIRNRSSTGAMRDLERLLGPLLGRAPFPEDGSLAYSGPIPRRDLQALVAELTDHASLRSLSLRGCGLDDSGADLLSRVVAFNPVLQRLDLGDNGIGAAGAQLLHNAMRQYNPGTLRAVCLDGNPCVQEAPELFPEPGCLELRPARPAPVTPRVPGAAVGPLPSPLRPLDAKVERRCVAFVYVCVCVCVRA